METKTDKVRRLVKSKYYKEALGICKDWIHPISKEESDTLRRGYECYHYPDFYKQLGYDPDSEINKAINILCKLYN